MRWEKQTRQGKTLPPADKKVEHLSMAISCAPLSTSPLFHPRGSHCTRGVFTTQHPPPPYCRPHMCLGGGVALSGSCCPKMPSTRTSVMSFFLVVLVFVVSWLLYLFAATLPLRSTSTIWRRGKGP